MEEALIVIAIAVVIGVIVFQILSFVSTKRKIEQLKNFFPTNVSNLEIVETSISQDTIASAQALARFVMNPPAKVDEEGYETISLIKIKGNVSNIFKEVVNETNAYLCKNIGTSAEFSLLQDICERKIEALDAQINTSLNVPLYLGLAGTFIGIITGVLGLAPNISKLFTAENTTPLTNLLIGVGIAMSASLLGLGLMIYNSAVLYKKALEANDNRRIAYYDFLRQNLMPVLSNSMASSLNSLKGVLGSFIGKFGQNLDSYADTVDILNDNIKEQHLLLAELNQMNQTQMAIQIAKTFKTLENSAASLETFHTYQTSLNDTIQQVNGAVGKIDTIISSFNAFTNALQVVVQNQQVAVELQRQFQTAIETHFPTGSEAREIWRKQYDELAEDAKSVSTELNNQLQASTEYIRTFADTNKDSFGALLQIQSLVDALNQYAQMQASCYNDLKGEITELKKEQVTSQSNYAKLNADLLLAVKEMTNAIKSQK